MIPNAPVPDAQVPSAPVGPLFDPADFLIAPGVTHVCAGGETAFLRRHAAALARYGTDKSSGIQGRTAQEARVLSARTRAALLWGVETGDIGLVSSVAEGVSMLAESLDWREGDAICIDANEYPSVAAPFALQRRPKLAVQLATGDAPDRIAAAVDERTRIIAVSYVSYLNGERVDLAALRRAADRVGALLVVDFTQAAGYLPIEASVADFAFAACYKWMLGMTGVALAYWNRARQPDWSPGTAGWHSLASGARPDWGGALRLQDDAMRFTRGNPAHGPVYVLDEALDYLSGFGMDAVQRHVQALTTDLHRRLTDAGLTPTTPADPARHGASVCIDHPRAQAIVNALDAEGVHAWNGRGRVRFSFHGYNAASDVARIIEALKRVL